MKNNPHSRLPSSDQNNPTFFTWRMWTDQVTYWLIFRKYLGALLSHPHPFFLKRRYYIWNCRMTKFLIFNRLLLLQIIVSHSKATAMHRTFLSDKHKLNVYDLQCWMNFIYLEICIFINLRVHIHENAHLQKSNYSGGNKARCM